MSRRNRRAIVYATEIDNSFRIDGFMVKKIGLSMPGYICTDPDHGRVNKAELLKKGKKYIVCWQCVQQKLNVAEAQLDPKIDPNPRANLEGL